MDRCQEADRVGNDLSFKLKLQRLGTFWYEIIRTRTEKATEGIRGSIIIGLFQ